MFPLVRRRHYCMSLCALVVLATCQDVMGQQEFEGEFAGSPAQPGGVIFSSNGFPNQKYEEINAKVYYYKVRSLQARTLIMGTFIDFDLAPSQKIEIFYNWSPSSLRPDVEFTQTEARSDPPSRPDFLTNSSVVVVKFIDPPHTSAPHREERYVGWTLHCTFHAADSGDIPVLPFTRCGSLDPDGGFYDDSPDGLEDTSTVDCIFHVKPGMRNNVYVKFSSLDSDPKAQFDIEVRAGNNSQHGTRYEWVRSKGMRSKFLSEGGLYVRVRTSKLNYNVKFTYMPLMKYTADECPAQDAWSDDLCCNAGKKGHWRVPRHIVCDTHNHCPRGEDEVKCFNRGAESGTGSLCPTWRTSYILEYRCPNGECVLYYPQSCKQNCGMFDWKCDDGYCIERVHVCDGVKNCFDGSDEYAIQCSSVDSIQEPEIFKCEADEWKCVSDPECIDLSDRCDGDYDCEDYSDELDCPLGSLDLDDDDDEINLNIPKIIGSCVGVICGVILLVFYVRRKCMQRRLHRAEQDMLNEVCQRNLERRAQRAAEAENAQPVEMASLMQNNSTSASNDSTHNHAVDMAPPDYDTQVGLQPQLDPPGFKPMDGMSPPSPNPEVLPPSYDEATQRL